MGIAEISARLLASHYRAGVQDATWLRLPVVEAPTEPTRPGPISDNEYYLVEKLIDEGKSAEEVERILRLFRGNESNPAIKQRNVALPV